MKALRPKVAIIGAGSVGSTFAYTLMISGLAREIVLVDANVKKAEGECMDLNHGLNFAHPAKIYASGFEGCADSDIVVITAGARQLPGQTRLELLEVNTKIFKEIIPKITRHAPNSILLVVSNPVDIMTYVTLKVSGFPAGKVIGSGTVLDTARFRYLISEHCGVDPRNIHAYIIGEHGDTEVALWSSVNIGGTSFAKFCEGCALSETCENEQLLERIFSDAKNAAYKIIDAKGSTYYGIGLALRKITKVILRDENSILPVSTLINGHYGISDVCLSLPSLVGKGGVERILTLELSGDERDKLINSANKLKDIIAQVKI